MRTSAKLGLTALVAALMLSAVGTASARDLSISNQNIRVTWSRLEFEGGLGIPMRCQVTLEGSFHARTIRKVLGTLVGAVTRVDFKTESCTNGRSRAEGFPWHITYEGFRGNLPNISGVLLLFRGFLFSFERPFGLSPSCRYGTATDHITSTVSLSGGVAGNLTPNAGNAYNLLEARNEELFGRCPRTGTFIGGATDGTIRLLGSSTTRITVTLI